MAYQPPRTNIGPDNLDSGDPNEMLVLIVPCRYCTCRMIINLIRSEMNELRDPNGRPVEEILPNVPPDIREIFISGQCPHCFADGIKKAAERAMNN